MIPKTIHYCWFGDSKKPKTVQRCINSWSKVMPDYKIKCWDNDSFDFDSISFVKDAIQSKKYAFAADYVRLYALYTEGGLYFDTDVLVKRSFDEFLDNDFFCGTEAYMVGDKLKYRMEAAIMGSQRNHSFIEECMSFYHKAIFDKNRLSSDFIIQPIISRYAEKYGYIYENKKQSLNGRMTVYPTSVFTNTLHQDNTNSDRIYAIHQNLGSWIDYSNRGGLFRFCKKYNLMNIYHWLEKTK